MRALGEQTQSKAQRGSPPPPQQHLCHWRQKAQNKREAFQTSVNTTTRQRAQAETTENHRNLHLGSSAPMEPREWVAGLKKKGYVWPLQTCLRDGPYVLGPS